MKSAAVAVADQPLAAPANTVVCGRARFTLLTDRLLRLEWDAEGVFEDRATLAVVNRAMPPVRHRAKRRGNTLVLNTDALTLTYTDDGKPFHRGNLDITLQLNGRPVAWRPGLRDRANLGATLRTLDGVRGDQRDIWTPGPDGKMKLAGSEPVDLGTGFVSRSGWALIDDSHNVPVGGTPEWVASRREGDRRDWYFFAHGHDYKAALRDAAAVFGRQPLPPRFAAGYWWSRYWAYTDQEIEELVSQFNRYQVPLDVMVIDMDWHLPGWTGYTWDRRYFPDPAEFLGWLKDNGLKVTLNLHPADGVARHEDAFPPMAAAMGLDPKRADKVPFNITDPKYMGAYFKHLHHPEEKRGVDFWWMDWQQGESTTLPGLDTLPWINHLHWKDMENNPARGDRRPLIFSRFGGYGAGRYCVGFSGDTHSVWESLKFQPRFTATAANVLYGYWSHDIGGHMPGQIEPELYLRWLQFGVHSPVLRTHTTKNEAAERRVFAYPEPYATLMMDLIRRRYEMIPYVYTEMRRSHDTAVSLCRPLYYDYPEAAAAYQAKDQYGFGDAMLVAPVLAPAAKTDTLAEVKFWLPAGDWWDTARGALETGGAWLRRKYTLRETPVFVRPGTIIPGQACELRVSAGSYRHLVVTCWPGAAGAYDLYEDDGDSCGYLRGESARIPLSQRQEAPGRRVIEIGKAEGRFPGFLAKRPVDVRLPASAPARSVRVAGQELPWSLRPAPGCWSYDGAQATVIICIPEVDVTRGATIEVAFNAKDSAAPAAGLMGLMARLAEIARLFTLAGSCHPLHPDERLVYEVAQTGNRISRQPASFAREMAALHRDLARLPALIKTVAKARGPWDGDDLVAKRKAYCAQCLAILKSCGA